MRLTPDQLAEAERIKALFARMKELHALFTARDQQLLDIQRRAKELFDTVGAPASPERVATWVRLQADLESMISALRAVTLGGFSPNGGKT